ncbi:MAG: calcium-binding protein [Pseudomonadota bacterium]
MTFFNFIFGNRLPSFLNGTDGTDIIFSRGGDDVVSDGGGNDFVRLGSGDDPIKVGAGNDIYIGGRGSDTVSFEDTEGGVQVDLRAKFASTSEGDKVLKSIENIIGSGQSDTISGNNRDNVLNGGGGSDELTGGKGRDAFAFDGDPFDGADISADGRQIIGGEDFITDFNFHDDRYQLNTDDFGVDGELEFASVNANTSGATADVEGANVIVLLNSDNDRNPDTPFLAGTAANQIAELVEEDGAGFFVYFNSNLGLNRLVYSENLNDASADLKIVTRQTDLEGQDAIDALAQFSEENFEFVSDDLAVA